VRRKRYKICRVCRKPKDRPPATKYASLVEYLEDPYCSTVCCKADHGLDDRAEKRSAA
jgi:hypothetical protein